MSSLLQSLDMSLDDLIAKKKPTGGDHGGRRGGGRGGRKNSSGPIRRSGASRGARNSTGPYNRRPRRDTDEEMVDSSNANGGTGRFSKSRTGGIRKASILSRLGGKDSGSSGTKLTVSNLKYDILEDDVTELFVTIGEVKKVEIVYDRTGRSTGTSYVWFARRSDAEKAIRQYNGRTLDGQPMKISLEGEANGGSANNDNDNFNKQRGGLFGSALKSARGDDTTFKVTLGGRGGGQRWGRGRGGRGGRGGRRNNDSDGKGAKTVGELDDEMDTYMNQ